MTTYSVYLPPIEDVEPAAERFKLVPDKKAVWAIIAPPIWLALHRLWLPLLAYVVFMLALALLGAWQPHVAVLYLSGLPGLYLLLEGFELVRDKLERHGWRYVGVVEAENAEDAEIKYLMEGDTSRLETAPAPTRALSGHVSTPGINQGLFPE
ncbi:MAG: DUF2628 domain-containing protein [Pseudomonadota bacterium]